MKARLRKIVRVLVRVPVLGRLIRILVAIIRLPEFRESQIRRQLAFETEQLPRLLEVVSKINHRQLENDALLTNLGRSVPVALRRTTRDLIDVRSGVDQATVGVKDLNANVGYLLGRVEFVRRELMFEMQYGAKGVGVGDQLRVEAQILSPDKVAAAQKENLRLNLGSGHVPVDGYVNVDRRSLPGVDIVAEIEDLPFEPGTVGEIFSAHMLEHFPKERLERELLGYWLGLLKPGGEFRAVVPDTDGMIDAYKSGEYPFDRFREVTYGSQEYDGDFHFNAFTVDSLSAALTAAGFVDIQLIAGNRENWGCKEFEISARRPAD